MKIDKAIEILELTDETRVWTGYPDSHEAIKLGIEALKLISRHRKYPLAVPIDALPGETRE